MATNSNAPRLFDYDGMMTKKFAHSILDIKERPGEVWLKLEEGGNLDKYVWRVVDVTITEDELLKFSIECLNSPEGVPDELYEYGAAIVTHALSSDE